MYAALWRTLPGPPLVRALICLALAALVVAACFAWLFPWVASLLPVNDPNVSAVPARVDPSWFGRVVGGTPTGA